MKEYICTYCGKDTSGVDYDYLIGSSHLACAISNTLHQPKTKKPMEISNWDKLVGNKFDVMGASFVIMDAEDNGGVYSAWIHPIDDIEAFVRVTLFADNMDLQLKVLPPQPYSDMTPYDLTSTITKNHLSNPSIFIQTIANGLASDSTTRDILSYISRHQDMNRKHSKGTGYSPGPGISGSSGNNLW